MISVFNPYIIGGTLLAFVLGVGGAYVKGRIDGADLTSAEYAAAALEQSRRALAATVALNGALNVIDRETVREVERIRVVTRTIIQKVPVHVTPEIDRRYPVPFAFVRVWNASASGRPVSEIALPPGKSDSDPSPTPISAVAAAAAANNGEQLACIEQVKGLVSAWEAARITINKPAQ
jgi:hypothetical protein